MSDTIESLNKRIIDLQNQVNGHLQATKRQVFEMDAVKAMYNESLSKQIEIRSTLNAHVARVNEDDVKLKDKDKQIASLNQQLSDATKRLADLAPKDLKQDPNQKAKVA